MRSFISNDQAHPTKIATRFLAGWSDCLADDLLIVSVMAFSFFTMVTAISFDNSV